MACHKVGTNPGFVAPGGHRRATRKCPLAGQTRPIRGRAPFAKDHAGPPEWREVTGSTSVPVDEVLVRLVVLALTRP